MEHTIVRTTDVTKSFKLGKHELQVLKGISLTIKTGRYISIMGPSGSGKSTLFNMIGGLDKPTSGKVFIDEVDIAQLDAYELAWLRCRKIGYIFQTFNLIPVMTALENVTLPMTFGGTGTDEANQRGKDLLAQVGLGDRYDHKPSELSGGMQKRIALARAMANNPDYIFFDEPTTGLDPITAQTINELIKRVQEHTGSTVVVVTHDLESATFVAQKIVLIKDGEKHFEGTPEEFQASDKGFVKLFRSGGKAVESYEN